MKRLFLLGFIVMLLAACNSANDNDKQSGEKKEDQELKQLQVEILTGEDAFEPGDEGKIEIQVTYGDEPVHDADEVLFEIWKHGDEEHDKIEGTHEKDGKYYVTYQFEEGVYYVVPHVTARGLHNMPKRMFLVGDVEPPKEQEGPTHDHGQQNHNQQNAGHNDGHDHEHGKHE